MSKAILFIFNVFADSEALIKQTTFCFCLSPFYKHAGDALNDRFFYFSTWINFCQCQKKDECHIKDI